MKNWMLVGAALSAGVALAETPLYKDASQSVEKRVEDLLSRMTTEEKIGQLYQSVAEPGWRPLEGQLDLVRKGGAGSFINLYRTYTGSVDLYSTSSRVCHDTLQKAAVEESRLGIPLIFGYDVIHGCYTTFPSPLSLACSFEPALFEEAQRFAAREARWAGYDWVFSPMCDTARDPRWGRVAETCGEDPYLVARCVEAQVRGFQGKDAKGPDRIPACMKHFVGYSDSMGGRDYNITECSEWTLRNLHLVPFRAATAAGVETVMSSFNTVDGRPAVDSRHTLTDVLRGEWGFTGFVVSDWDAVAEAIAWNYAADKSAAARLALNAGNDMEMFSDCYITSLKGEIDAGRVTAKTLDDAVRNVLRVKFRTGLFEHPYAYPVPPPDELAKLTDEARAHAKVCAAKSAVLVKNDGVLPLEAAKRVTLIGPFAEDREQLLGCWDGRSSHCRTTFADALRHALPEGSSLTVVKGCAVNDAAKTRTAEDGVIVVDKNAAKDASLDRDGVTSAIAASDVVILAIGEDRAWTGENHSRASLGLTGRQQELFDLAAAQGKPVVAVVFSGRPLTLPAVWEKSAAVFYAFQPGCEGGPALADLIVGASSPEGRLSMSVAREVGAVPCFYNDYATGRPGSGKYNDRTEHGAKFPFGYGLAYTTFAYGETKVRDGVASCTVTNTGAREGVETVQLYIRQFACEEGVVPQRELRGFRKVALKPGESASVSFALDDAALAHTGRDGRLFVTPGRYAAKIAPNALAGEMTEFTRK